MRPNSALLTDAGTDASRAPQPRIVPEVKAQAREEIEAVERELKAIENELRAFAEYG